MRRPLKNLLKTYSEGAPSFIQDIFEPSLFIEDILLGPLVHSRHPVRLLHSFKTFCEAPLFIHLRHSVKLPRSFKTFCEAPSFIQDIL